MSHANHGCSRDFKTGNSCSYSPLRRFKEPFPVLATDEIEYIVWIRVQWLARSRDSPDCLLKMPPVRARIRSIF